LITLYCREGCPACEPAAEELDALAIRHRIIRLPAHAPLPDELPAGTRLPALLDGGCVCSGADDVIARITELAEFKEDWYRFQSDACYCNE
jgi:hypothetical protein